MRNFMLKSMKYSRSFLEKFLEPIEKNPYFVIITGEPVSATMSRTLDQKDLHISPLFLVLLLIMQSQPASIA